MIRICGFVLGLAGMWLLSDSVWSIFYYLDRADKYHETFWRNHWVRAVRGIWALVIMAIGLWLVR